MFGRGFRRRRYRQIVGGCALRLTDSARVVDELAYVWRHLHLQDLTAIPVEARCQKYLSVLFPNLPTLVDSLREHNRLIAIQADQKLEIRQGQLAGEERQQVVLDFYLADDDRRPIAEEALFRRLQGLLQEHKYLLDNQTTQYYHRKSEIYYQDLIELTKIIIDVI